jgi:hypothetical protein
VVLFLVDVALASHSSHAALEVLPSAHAQRLYLLLLYLLLLLLLLLLDCRPAQACVCCVLYRAALEGATLSLALLLLFTCTPCCCCCCCCCCTAGMLKPGGLYRAALEGATLSLAAALSRATELSLVLKELPPCSVCFKTTAMLWLLLHLLDCRPAEAWCAVPCST